MDGASQEPETSTASFSPSRFYAMMIVGTALVFTGLVLMIWMSARDYSAASSEFSAIPVEVDFAAPELKLRSLSGGYDSLANHRGEVVLVNLWATWCPPCRAEMPALQAFFEEYKSAGLILIAINQEEGVDIVEAFVEEFGLNFPVWLDERYLAQREFGTANLPSSYVIDRSGRVRLMWIGGISKQNLKRYVPQFIME